jgi:adenylate cyclase class 1
VLDRNCLPNSVLAAISQSSRSERVQIFFKRREATADIFVLDEMGSLYSFNTPYRDEQSLLKPLHQFMQSTLFRQRSETMQFNGMTDALLDNIDHNSIDYYEIVSELAPAHVERRIPSPADSSHFFNVQAIADHDFNSNLIFNIYCDQQEFTELELGDQLYDTVAQYIFSRRSSRDNYPCYITDIDLSRCISDSGSTQTVHYLRYKQRLERALNEALARIS